MTVLFTEKNSQVTCFCNIKSQEKDSSNILPPCALHVHQGGGINLLVGTMVKTVGPFTRGKIRRVLNNTRTFRINGTFRLK